jgi:hypothetical protein
MSCSRLAHGNGSEHPTQNAAVYTDGISNDVSPLAYGHRQFGHRSHFPDPLLQGCTNRSVATLPVGVRERFTWSTLVSEGGLQP